MAFDWNFYDKLNEMVYVSDIDTYEIKYVNQKILKEFGYSSVDEIIGKPCYKVLRGRDSACDNCTSPYLKEGEFYEWEAYNKVLDKYFSLKDTLVEVDGRRLRLELTFDLTLQKQLSASVNAYAFNEAMLYRGIQLALEEKDNSLAIDVLLEYLGERFQSERAYLFEKKDDGYSNTYEWCSTGVEPQKENLAMVPDEDLEIWLRAFRKGENIIIKAIEEVEEQDPAIYRWLEPQGIHSLVVSPIIEGGVVVGFFGVDNPPAQRLNNVSTLFSITGYFFNYLIKRRDNTKYLELLSYCDQLTGLKNRHALADSMQEIMGKENVGLAYCDVMGLKSTNDKEGHAKGDALLIRAADCLRKVFPEFEIFRVGGDEFVALCIGLSEEEIEERAQKLKAESKRNNSLMAIGVAWTQNLNVSLEKLLKKADERMYYDKRSYYESKEFDRRER